MDSSAPTTAQAPPKPRSELVRRLYLRGLALLRELPGTGKRFWVLVVVTGVAAGLGAVLLVQMLRWFQGLAWPAEPTFLEAIKVSPGWYRVLICTLGGGLVTLAALIARRPMAGHGTAAIIESIWFRSGRMPLGWTVYRGVISIAAVALGAPLGREGALLQFGSATGSAFARRLRLPGDQARLLVACGASAGIAAAYNVPIGASIFGLEVLLGSFALESFGPIVAACVVATLISRILIADHPSYVIPHHALMRPRELLLDLAVGPVLGVACALYNKTVSGAAVLLERVPRDLFMFMPIFGMAAVGVGAIWLPDLLGNGYDSVNMALLGQVPVLVLFILPFAKMFATALCSGCGIPGGLFTPSLFVGAFLGGSLGHIIHLFAPSAAPAGAYALIGMGAVLAGTTHAPVSAVLIIFELTGSYDVILPLMLTAVLSTGVSRWLVKSSLYSAPLQRRNLTMPSAASAPFGAARTVTDIMTPGASKVVLSLPFREVVLRLLDLRAGNDLYVTSPEGQLLGVIVLDTLKTHLPEQSLLNMTIAADVMDERVQPVPGNAALSELAGRFAQTDMERLPVTDERGHLIGTVAKRDVLRYGKF